MHHAFFVASYEERDLSSLRSLLNSLQEWDGRSQHQSCPGAGTENVLINICQVDRKFEFVDDCAEEYWTVLGSVEVENVLQQMEASSSRDESSATEKIKLADYLLDLADHLPYAGFTLDVYIINPNMSRESCIHTLGALMRLREWHSAQITVVAKKEEPPASMTKVFASVLHAEQLSSDEISTVQRPEWRGTLVWPGDKGFVEQGISLESRDKNRLQQKLSTLHFWNSSEKESTSMKTDTQLVFGRQLELLACLTLASVPLYFIDDFNLYLHANTKTCVGQLASSLTCEDALLLRIPLYEKCAVPVASVRGLSTAAWKDGIAGTGQSAPDVEKEPLPCRQYLFLLVPGGQDLTTPFKACVMRSPSEVTGDIFQDLSITSSFGFSSQDQTETDSKTLKSIETTLQGLPLLTATDFTRNDSIWMESVIHHINKQKDTFAKQGKEFELTTSELTAYMRESQETLFQQGRKQEEWHSAERTSVTSHHFVSHPDLQSSPSEWPEKRTLLESESKAKVLRRYQSNESCSLMLSSPLAPEDSSMDAKDMVKWFRPDGNAIQEDLSPVKPAVQPLRLSNDEEKNLQWPACKDVQYHDVYYEHIKKCERQEKFYQKFRDNILLEEGQHVCSDRPHVPALKYRNAHRRSQMDITCGGSKLTPITRTLSPSSMLVATPSAKKLWAEESSGSKRMRSRRLTEDSVHMSTRKAKVKRESMLSCERDHSDKDRHQSASSKSGENSNETNAVPPSGNSLFYPKKSDPSLPPFRRLETPDAVNIFTPPASQRRLSLGTHSRSSSVLKKNSRGAHRDIPSASVSSDNSTAQLLSDESMDNAGSSSSSTDKNKQSRSERHKRKLEKVVSSVLVAAGIQVNDILYNSCFSKLFQVTKFFAMQLPHSHNLKTEMKNIAEKQVEQVVDLERRRRDLAVMKKLRRSSLAPDMPSKRKT